MMRNILYIHGAYASAASFSHMVGRLPAHRAVFADYDCRTSSVDATVRRLKVTTAERFADEPYSIVAHSLGGVVGLRLAAGGAPVERMFTMSAPFGGSRAASLFSLVFALTPVFADIDPYGPTIRSVLDGEIRFPIRSIVSTAGGSPMMREDNDGVVTVASQTCLVGPDYHAVAVNHHEVVQAGPVIDLAQDFLFGSAVGAIPEPALSA
ncbi:hypothetical protein HL658_02755 [Azospirillum sp. RWY-5-1]|uniref:AB hydrolase-1 domain-containing protein n=1 Tax=Azospirillum oleiclasticum TaxID=2735135 RepID=A0ABX2T2T1_9PROT|nr:alpha/beta fold hydrolase [Azospirillum oleiclasticum]NYZ11456.1 hypothetical protein [Azospirillum oleiclasticum]NYZ18617.1 hypothetical protein [Azospirillum oleiclasticum]